MDLLGIKSNILGAVQQAPMAFMQGLADIFIKPPQKLIEIWNGLSPEDQALFKQAALAGARVGARALIAYANGGKVNF
jgi:hypothetical protein